MSHDKELPEVNLMFSQIPAITIATNIFVCKIPVRYKDEALLEFVKDIRVGGCYPQIPIYHPDGTKLAVAKGSQLYSTAAGQKAGVEMIYPQGATVCRMGGRPLFEIRRQGAAALKMDAELCTFDGQFIKWTEHFIGVLLLNGQDCLRLGGTFQRCRFEGVVGIQLGQSTQSLPAAVCIPGWSLDKLRGPGPDASG